LKEDDLKSLFLKGWKAFIRYHEIPGTDETLVFLPGLNFPSIINYLPTVMHNDLHGYNSILVDYLGSGFSDYPDDFDHTIESHAHAISAILDHREIKKCTIIGHSMGGVVGIMLAHLRPDLIKKLIISESNITPGGGDGTSWIASHSESEYTNIAHLKHMTEMRKEAISGNKLAKFLCSAWHNVDPSSIYRNSKVIVNLDPSFKEKFFQLKMPRTFIYGERSLPNNTGISRADVPDPGELEMHGINTAVIPDAGHFMMIDNLQGYVEILKSIL
jgi:pimeloyl-ACP methyl ester carboxylesterase